MSMETREAVARRWGLSSAQLPQAVQYLHAVLLETDGQLERVEIQYRPDGERHVFRATDAGADQGLVFTARPLGWDRRRELTAMADLCAALAGASG
jgi:hypothetical protein